MIPKNNVDGFRRAGIWPFDPCWIIDQPRPTSLDGNAPLLTADELVEKLEKRREELCECVLGSDGVVVSSGLMETQNGCVFTSCQALRVSMDKSPAEKEKRSRLEK